MSSLSFNKYRVLKIVRETAEIRSIYLMSTDGSPQPNYLPGQHLLFALPGFGGSTERKILRFYTLSDCYRAGDPLRITVKKETPADNLTDAPDGEGSSYIHNLSEGSILNAQGPLGDFYLMPEATAPVVLIGAGIGLTPVVAMAKAVTTANPSREVYLFLAMRNKANHPLKSECEDLARKSANLKLYVYYSQPTDDDIHGVDYHHRGRLTAERIEQALPHLQFDFYICGPRALMTDIGNGLTEHGVDVASIHTESFGPAHFKASDIEYEPKGKGSDSGDKPHKETPVMVTFSRSGQTHQWDKNCKSLLEFAAAKEISIQAGCLYGDCGTCLTAFSEGRVSYNHPTEVVPEPGFCLPCSCKPAESITLEV